jgi:hypothetical protein
MKKVFIVVLALLDISVGHVVGGPSTSRASLPPSVVGLFRRDLGELLGNGGDDPFLSPITELSSKTIHPSKSSQNPSDQLSGVSGILGEIAGTPIITPLYTDSMINTLGSQTISDAKLSSATSPASETVDTEAAVTNTSTSNDISKDSKEWRVIGVAVLTISGVALVVVLVIFFDKWWRFMRDVVFGKRRNAGAEFLVPDWEKGNWEDGCRYPSLWSETLVRQSSSRHQDVDLRHPFPARPNPSLHSSKLPQEASSASDPIRPLPS